MLFYFNTSGSAMTSIPSPIYQGSVGVNEILVLAPFPASTTVTASFVLPNGVKLYPRLANNKGTPNVEEYPYHLAQVTGFSLEGMNLWCLTLDKALTQYAGTLLVQFSFTDTKGKKLTSDTVTVNVSPGVPSMPIDPDEADYEDIGTYLAQAATAAENAQRAETAAVEAKDLAVQAKTAAEAAAAASDQARSAAEAAKTAAESEAEKAKTEADNAKSAEDGAQYYYTKAGAYANSAINASEQAVTAKNQAEAASTTATTAVSQANTLLAEVNALVGDLDSALDEIHTYATFKKGGGV